MGTKTLGRWIAELLSERKDCRRQQDCTQKRGDGERLKTGPCFGFCLQQRNTSSIHLFGLACFPSKRGGVLPKWDLFLMTNGKNSYTQIPTARLRKKTDLHLRLCSEARIVPLGLAERANHLGTPIPALLLQLG